MSTLSLRLQASKFPAGTVRMYRTSPVRLEVQSTINLDLFLLDFDYLIVDFWSRIRLRYNEPEYLS